MAGEPDERLTLLPLGIQGDQPPDPEQPPLPDGQHLRWAFPQDLGFPWHGFYLFRRETEARIPRCLGEFLGDMRPGSPRGTRLETPLGRLSSPQPLLFTEAFPPASRVEVDLDRGSPLRFDLPAGVEARRVDVQIGFREVDARSERTCVDFRLFPFGTGPSPRTEKGAVFQVAPARVSPSVAETAIEQWAGSPPGLQCTRRLEITLPCQATRVDLLLTNRGELRVEGLGADGASAGVQNFGRLTLNATTVTLAGKALARVTVESSIFESALLHEVCWECPAAVPAGRQVFADFKSWPLGERPNPVTEQGVRFEVRDERGQPLPFASFEKRVQAWTGLRARNQVEIQLPCPTSEVTMQFSRGSNDPAVHVQAFNQDGTLAQSLVMNVGRFGAEGAILKGAAITRLLVDAPGPDALLHHVVFQCATARTAEIEVRALAGVAVVDSKLVKGATGQVASASLAGAGITAVEIAPGKAALVELCYLPSRQAVTFGWGEVPGFQYPLCLPVAHPDYPCPSRPADFDAAKTLALSRVTYPAPKGWDQGFAELHGELVALVQGGPSGGSMAGRTHPDLPGQPLSPASQADVPKLPGLHPLDLILLASLQPAFAQMLGLYFVDQEAAPGVLYDYLLLADPTGVLGGGAASALAWLAFDADPAKVDFVLVTGRRTEKHPPIAPPGAGKAYALPGPAVRQLEDGKLPEVAGQVGLWWPLPSDSTDEQPDRLVFYYPRRVSLGTATPGAPPPDAAYQPLPGSPPILVSEPDPANPPAPPNPRSPDWPPQENPIYLVDGNLAEGWYSYRFVGQDLFGRHSPLGPPAEWYQWDPPPPKPGEPPPPRPWYYQTANPGHHSIHPYAVALLDKVPPAPPLGVEAWALDPLDRWVLADEPYGHWRTKVGTKLVGLRVRWRWTHLQQLQAPDTREFRIYHQPGRWNALLGRVVKVTAAAPDQSDVELDLVAAGATGAFAGTRLRVGNQDFAILGSQPGPPLRLRVKNIGVHDEIPPAEGKPCTLAIPEKHDLWVDTSLPKSWAKRLAAVPYDPPVRTVFDPSNDPSGQPLTTSNVTFESVPVTVTGNDVHFGAGPDLSGVQPWLDHLWLQAGTASEAYRIVRYDAAARTVTLGTAPTLGGLVTAWVLGRPAREYEIFLPAPDVGLGKPFEPSLEEPAVYAQIAVSAADDKKHVADDPKWSDPARFGNESRLSPSATVFRVLQTPPEPPDLPDLGERLYATPADYHSRSFTTFRFNDPQKPLRVHILRAGDDSLFQRDWLIRETRRELNPLDSPASGPPNRHLEFFPDGWNEAKRMLAAATLDAIKASTDYAALSTDARYVLALLPGNEGVAKKEDPPPPQDQPLWDRDWLLRRTRNELAPADAGLFPKSWNATQKANAATELNGIDGLADYAKLADNSLRVLAGLPGNETAFTQITLAPLEMKDPQIQDERRPDDDAGYTSASTDIRAYTDALPGRATNRYFYRARFVDGAQNQSSLSLAGPPVYLRKVEPPRAPVITKVIGGDRQITIQWAANREQDLAAYRLYRTDNAEKASDVRSMELLKTLTQVEVHFSEPSPEWIDNENLIGGRRYHYRLTAANTSNNESTPTRVHVGVAVDMRVPPPPIWTEQTWLLRRQADGVLIAWRADNIVPAGYKPVLRLGWRTETLEPKFILTRWRTDQPNWLQHANPPVVASAVDLFTFQLLDDDVSPSLGTAYRLKVQSPSGVWSTEYSFLSVMPPRGVNAPSEDPL